MKILLVMSLIMLAFVVGMIAPDVDQKIGLIVHRSILTHGPWVRTRRNPPGYKEQQPVCDTTDRRSILAGVVNPPGRRPVPERLDRLCVNPHTRVWQPARGSQRHLDLGIPRYLSIRSPVSRLAESAARRILSEHPATVD